MWRTLTIYHQKNPANLQNGLVWKTCLRSIQFLVPGEALDESQEYFQGNQAHRFLVEICAGLHSPLVGETEVFGQFREFRAKTILPLAWIPLLNAVEEDARKIRRELLTSLGPQNYGSLIRKYLVPQEQIVLVGAGRLAKELLPWMEEQEVYCLARNPEKVELNCKLNTSRKEELPANAKWIIAAPVSNEYLLSAWNAPSQILDLRGEASFPPNENYLSLADLYAQLEVSRTLAERQKRLALARVEEISARRAMATLHRPYGWEDMFA